MNNNINPEEMLPKVEKMLFKLAHSFSRTYYPLSYEECLSEAYFGFMRACRTYKPDRSRSFSSWCYLAAWGSLQTMIMKRSACPLSFMEIDDEILKAEEAPGNLDFFEELSLDAKELLELFIESPAELMRVSPKSVEALVNSTKRYLIHCRGMTPDNVILAYKEVHYYMQQAPV